jgi:hypothetical protein
MLAFFEIKTCLITSKISDDAVTMSIVLEELIIIIEGAVFRNDHHKTGRSGLYAMNIELIYSGTKFIIKCY